MHPDPHRGGAIGLLALLCATVAANQDCTNVANHRGPIITVTTVEVGAPCNAAVGIVPFTDAIYQTCADAPDTSTNCQMVGGVEYQYEIGQVEITVAQYVVFLNIADPTGNDRHHLFNESESSTAWPKYGQINFSATQPTGAHYSVAYPEWDDKPYGFNTFFTAARFVNSLNNGHVLCKEERTSGSFHYTSYRVRLSRRTETGMYRLKRPGPTRTKTSGFVIPSQDEWIKAAYFDPRGGGTYSYWKYPTNPGVFGDGAATAPSSALLDSNGDVTNAATQPLSNHHASGQPASSWCPSQVSATDCSTVNPLGLDPSTYASIYQGSLSSVGQTVTTSPWGTLDQGGNAVEWTDTITPPPANETSARIWRRLHGGVANGPSYQLWLSAVGEIPEDDIIVTGAYPWVGFRIGVIGKPTVW